MGIRIAKFDGEDRWICYASATDACYEPIFLDELSAWLYAHVVTVRHSLVLEHPEYAIGEEVQKFVKLTYGGNRRVRRGRCLPRRCSEHHSRQDRHIRHNARRRDHRRARARVLHLAEGSEPGATAASGGKMKRLRSYRRRLRAWLRGDWPFEATWYV